MRWEDRIDDEEAIALRSTINELPKADPRTGHYSDNETMLKILTYMSRMHPLDYEVVMETFERTEEEMRERGNW